ncbi:GtrA family protein [Oribacterium sp. WCC10]|uniref:GtrA family protein n=1 Tax=Oribacterium sp. WCC10 TaxID=1855343 RepID=UPI0008E61B6E|nr:GtrA family protein [Oribacterium sp. WCC10]SFG19542.1 Putative flippase GtrA (transmembrane translocase of bactoprenol-linked glucose) [Oribacterium sp. WCC10]
MQRLKDLYMSYRQIINYLIVGGLTTVVSLFSYYICVTTVFDPKSPVQLQIANVISWVAAVTFAYFTNRKYVFESSAENLYAEAVRFYVSRVSTLLLDMAIMFMTVTFMGMNDKVAKLLVQVIVTITNYIFSKYLVFGRK